MASNAARGARAKSRTNVPDGLHMGLMDDLEMGGSRVIQINARFQGFAYEGALRLLSVQQVAAALGGGKTRQIDLE